MCNSQDTFYLTKAPAVLIGKPIHGIGSEEQIHQPQPLWLCSCPKQRNLQQSEQHLVPCRARRQWVCQCWPNRRKQARPAKNEALLKGRRLASAAPRLHSHSAYFKEGNIHFLSKPFICESQSTKGVCFQVRQLKSGCHCAVCAVL